MKKITLLWWAIPVVAVLGGVGYYWYSHSGQKAKEVLLEALRAFQGTVLIVSHDRWFLDRVATHILAFEGDSQVVWFDGNYSEYEAERKKRLGAKADQPQRIKYRHLTRD